VGAGESGCGGRCEWTEGRGRPQWLPIGGRLATTADPTDGSRDGGESALLRYGCAIGRGEKCRSTGDDGPAQ
jgi:hypothetical protein